MFDALYLEKYWLYRKKLKIKIIENSIFCKNGHNHFHRRIYRLIDIWENLFPEISNEKTFKFFVYRVQIFALLQSWKYAISDWNFVQSLLDFISHTDSN